MKDPVLFEKDHGRIRPERNLYAADELLEKLIDRQVGEDRLSDRLHASDHVEGSLRLAARLLGAGQQFLSLNCRAPAFGDVSQNDGVESVSAVHPGDCRQDELLP
jgi:hypothetical protein